MVKSKRNEEGAGILTVIPMNGNIFGVNVLNN
jgi:hypothetical protein